jgi:hypothetical protein
MNETESANLSVGDFYSVWLEKEEDPPACKGMNSEDIKEGDGRDASPSEGILMSNVLMSGILTPDEDDESKEKNGLVKENENNIKKYSRGENIDENKENTGIILAEKTKCEEDASLHAFQIDESEIENYILSKSESKEREVLWEEMYGEFITDRENKVVAQKKVYSRRKRKEYNSLGDALKSVVREKKFSSKINYSVIEDLFS